MSSGPVYTASTNILMQPTGYATGQQVRYPHMKVHSIRVFSIFAIILGVASIAIQIAALVLLATETYYCVYFDIDYVGHGIWAGVFYVIAGSLGMAATYIRTKSLLVGTVVMAAISIASSIVAAVLSGMTAGYYNSYYNYDNSCRAWYALEWTLFSISVLAFVTSIVLTILPSLALCSKKTTNNQLPYVYGPNGQLVFVQPQPMPQVMQQVPIQYAFVNNTQPQQNVTSNQNELKPTSQSGASKTT